MEGNYFQSISPSSIFFPPYIVTIRAVGKLELSHTLNWSLDGHIYRQITVHTSIYTSGQWMPYLEKTHHMHKGELEKSTQEGSSLDDSNPRPEPNVQHWCDDHLKWSNSFKTNVTISCDFIETVILKTREQLWLLFLLLLFWGFLMFPLLQRKSLDCWHFLLFKNTRGSRSIYWHKSCYG